MTIDELKAKLEQYPGTWTVAVDDHCGEHWRVTTVDSMVGTLDPIDTPVPYVLID